MPTSQHLHHVNKVTIGESMVTASGFSVWMCFLLPNHQHQSNRGKCQIFSQ